MRNILDKRVFPPKELVEIGFILTLWIEPGGILRRNQEEFLECKESELERFYFVNLSIG